jgi:hypothetical protein
LRRPAPREGRGQQREGEREPDQHRTALRGPQVRAERGRVRPAPAGAVEREQGREREQPERAGLHPGQPLAEGDAGQVRAEGTGDG